MMLSHLQTEKLYKVTGPVGLLEVAVGQKPDASPKQLAIICHPHPLHGGTMYNKVVTTLVKTFQNLNMQTVRFNFRGVGKSEGQFDHGNGELNDLLTVIMWAKATFGLMDIWLAGFSFGAYVAAKAATELSSLKELVLVAPPVINFPMQVLPPILCPFVVVQGEEDEVVSAEAVFKWAESRKPPPKILRLPQASHFFHGQLSELQAKLEETLRIG